MNDFFDDLKAIKKDLAKQEKMQNDSSKISKTQNFKAQNSKTNDEFDLEKESIKAREKRLKDEFMEYAKFAGIKRV